MEPAGLNKPAPIAVGVSPAGTVALVEGAKDVLGDEALVRGVDVPLGEIEAGDDRRNSLDLQSVHDRHRAAGANEQRATAEGALEGGQSELDRRCILQHLPRRTRGEELDAQLGTGRSRFA